MPALKENIDFLLHPRLQTNFEFPTLSFDTTATAARTHIQFQNSVPFSCPSHVNVHSQSVKGRIKGFIGILPQEIRLLTCQLQRIQTLSRELNADLS